MEFNLSQWFPKHSGHENDPLVSAISLFPFTAKLFRVVHTLCPQICPLGQTICGAGGGGDGDEVTLLGGTVKLQAKDGYVIFFFFFFLIVTRMCNPFREQQRGGDHDPFHHTKNP